MNGTYMFYVSGFEYERQYLQLDIVLNNVSKVRMMGNYNTGYQTGTIMVILTLHKGRCRLGEAYSW